MEFEDLSKEVQEFVYGLKHGSSTIEADIRDAIEMSANEETFIKVSIQHINNLKGEVEEVIKELKAFKKR